MFTVSVKVEPALPPPTATLSPERSQAASDAILVVVVLAVVMVCLFALVLIYRRRKRRTLNSGACSCLKFNFVEVANLYYFKVEEKHSDDLVKTGSEN
jgi:beta-lactamase regulating signal transducer with metallopeptidase domain